MANILLNINTCACFSKSGNDPLLPLANGTATSAAEGRWRASHDGPCAGAVAVALCDGVGACAGTCGAVAVAVAVVAAGAGAAGAGAAVAGALAAGAAGVGAAAGACVTGAAGVAAGRFAL